MSENIFQKDKDYNGTIKGFRYSADFAFLVVSVNGANASMILGNKSDHPMTEMMALKQCSSVDFMCTGEKILNNVTYPRLRITSINF